ncbi:hypothetical protein AB0395_47555 [Streptosporangium sp. NPDC051023]|uniref:hypothetical protein n=1 Tax=Streptosporangium sp. NPDC051023 TaxID=3155410 RepID=UPI00344CBB55
MDVVEEIRAAAVTLKQRAEHTRRAMKALPGPEYPTVEAFHEALSRQFPTSRGMAEHVAEWTPEVAEALAAWLEEVADEAVKHAAGGWGNHIDEVACGWPLAVARAINGVST